MGKLRDLREVTDSVLKKFSSLPDAKCYKVESVTTDDGDRFRRVYISGVEPNDIDLARWVADELSSDGWGGIEVHLRW